MATTIVNCFLSLSLLTLIIKGSCDCSLNNINIGTTRTGKEIQGKPEWKVTVTNNCSCAQSQIQLSCQGFQSAEIIDSSIVSVKSGVCLLINGRLLRGFDSVVFSYAWDPPVLMLPKSSILGACP
ncbi:hypothetical protein HN51_047571 [Arachis hypogaea]|uniref:Uncharacterized protein n=2 Tax=Arachis TaxID=3817 RepID=A0A445EEY8_ARAHY|nr:uncharacterized protein LOC107474405 [Arachis duranensis]XP_016186550.1 uncharacterized protein LOC107628350 [Arachis ipaensis]XP_025632956.1 uncharacterized protein LOC112727437 [Arachis hypogaea]XP_025648572.1 uncharacterized protein LOC112743535 [Arachis hypogaea]XP_057743822.1 uncharacterized protein LOC130961819 [Arachis stenosperma]QHO23922.1 uncharacterized protein DS421_12g367780 [Arachis hypogaea]QHO53219.1 uncharacterized protein DS421_2g45960 [Arachis hypogaea]RYR25764.1 hypoth